MEQEDTGILKDLVTGIRKQLSERLVSPLMPAFTISWLIVNYRLIVAILSDGSLESRLTFIDTNLYPTIQFTIVHGFLFPLAYALVYIFAYPYPAKWIYSYSLKRQRELREARQQAENSSVLTLEESQRLRTYYYDREAFLQRQIREQQEEAEQLRAKITELEKSQQQDKENITPERVPLRLLTAKELTENQTKVLAALSDAENKNREYSSEKDLLETLGYNMTDLRLILEDLLMARFVSRTFNNGYIYTLTHEGRKAIKEAFEEKTTGKLGAAVHKQEVKAAVEQKRVFVGESITPKYLFSFFSDHTAIQAAKMTEAYIGKWMKVTGTLQEVMSSTPDLAQVTFKDMHAPYLFMWFQKAWIDRVAILKRGDTLTVIGQIDKIDTNSVQLDNCELVDTE